MVPSLPTLTPVKMAWCLLNIWTASFSHWGTVAKKRWVKLGTLCSKAGDSSLVLHHGAAIPLATCYSLTLSFTGNGKAERFVAVSLRHADSFRLVSLMHYLLFKVRKSILCQKTH